jgi:hypothetical protein
MFVSVDVLYGETATAPIVPNSALYRHPRDGREGVYAASLAAAAHGAENPSPPSGGAGTGLEPIGPVPVEFVPVRVIARGRLSSAVEGVTPGQWVVTVGHRLLGSDDVSQAVIQPTPWEHILRLQQMQTRDLLQMIEDRQGTDAGAALN